MRHLLVIAALLSTLVADAQVCGARMATPAFAPADVALTLFLVGDAGLAGKNCVNRPLCNDRVLRELQADVNARASELGADNVVVVFLGDNVYPYGLSSSATDRARLDAQVDVVRPSRVRTFFVPGNHDWNNNDVGGQQRIKAEAARLAAEAAAPSGPRVMLRPGNACPGPEVETFGNIVSLVFIDTAWWLQPSSDRPACGGEVLAEAALRTTLASLTTPVIVASHHAFEKSAGAHGTRTINVTKQDFRGAENVRMRDRLQRAVRESGTRPLLWAAGHDHSLQLFTGGLARYHLISGTGFDRAPTSVRCNVADLAFGVEARGWIVLDFPRDGSAPRLEVREVPRAATSFSRRLN